MKVSAASGTEQGLHVTNQDALLISLDKKLFAVADGVTTTPHSERASHEAVRLLEQLYPAPLDELAINLNKTISAMNDMGTTTLTAAVIRGEILEVVHVGDSSLFLIRDTVLKVTEDDSTPGSRVIVQVLGKGTVQPHLYRLRLQKGDIIVLATDGVANYLSPEELKKGVNLPLDRVPAQLIRTAKAKKKLYEDDKTVVVVAVD